VTENTAHTCPSQSARISFIHPRDGPQTLSKALMGNISCYLTSELEVIRERSWAGK
jgi:hypothetical protein